MGCATSKVEISRSGSHVQVNEEYVEEIVCDASEIGENEMKTFDLGEDGKVLLIRQKGRLSALGAKCTHYGAPLVNGALGEGRVRCPWHGACYNILTGDIEDFPGLDSLPCYQVTIDEDNNVKVRAKKSELETNKRTKAMVKRGPMDCVCDTIVVVGGGPSGAVCVETLRQEGFTGEIVLICKELHLPYDRVKVSKSMDFDIEKAQFRSEQFYKDANIDIKQNVEVVSVDTDKKYVKLSNGVKIRFNRLYLATGMRANRPQIPGGDLKNVIVLRNYDDAAYTNAQLNPNKDVIILGSSFIAMEAASYVVNKVNKLTVVFKGALPFQPLLGDKIGLALLELFKEKGVHFVKNSGIKECIDKSGDGSVGAVKLLDDTVLKADLVIVGIGTTCNTEFLQNSNVNLRPNGSVEVDEHLQTNVDGIYAGGDIAYAPVWSHDNKKVSIGHYGLAHYHGRIAALNILGHPKKLKAVPYFWTMLFGRSIRYAGHGTYDDIIYSGNIAEYKFVAFYLYKHQVVAVSSCGMDPIVSKFAELLVLGKKLFRKDIESDPLLWTKSN